MLSRQPALVLLCLAAPGCTSNLVVREVPTSAPKYEVCAPSDIEQVQSVQRSLVFRSTARLLFGGADTASTRAAEESRWLCEQLRLAASPRLLPFSLVYAPAELGIRRVDVIFAVDELGHVTLLSTIEQGRIIAGQVDKTAWNAHVQAHGALDINGPDQASTLACYILRIEEAYMPETPCEPVSGARITKLDGVWHVTLVRPTTGRDVTLQIAASGALL